MADFDLFMVHVPVPLKYVDPAERYPSGWYNDAASTKVVIRAQTYPSGEIVIFILLYRENTVPGDMEGLRRTR